MKVKGEVDIVTVGARGVGTAFVDRDVSERPFVVAAYISLTHAREAADGECVIAQRSMSTAANG
jgi:hypothetical protein